MRLPHRPDRHDAPMLVNLVERTVGAGDEAAKNIWGDCNLTATGNDEHQPAPDLNDRRLLAEKAAIHALPLDLEKTEQAHSGRHSQPLNKGAVNGLTKTSNGYTPVSGGRQGGHRPPCPPAFSTPADC